MRPLAAVLFIGAIVAPAVGVIEKTARSGPVKSLIQLEPDAPVIGDDLTLTVRVTADKGVELISPEFGQMLDRFEIVDFSTTEKVDDQGRTVLNQQYTLATARSGRQSIPPILVEYVDRRPDAKPAPDGLDAYEHLTEQLDFEIASSLPADAKADLHPALGPLPPLATARARTWTWAVVAAAAAIAALMLWRLWALSRRQRRKSAYEIASARLSKLLGQARNTAEEIDAFFVELSAIVRWYLENRFDLRAPELTTEEFLSLAARSPDLSRDHQIMLRDFLHRADLVKFSAYQATEQDVDQSIRAAQRFLDETRQIATTAQPVPELAHA